MDDQFKKENLKVDEMAENLARIFVSLIENKGMIISDNKQINATEKNNRVK